MILNLNVSYKLKDEVFLYGLLLQLNKLLKLLLDQLENAKITKLKTGCFSELMKAF